jgi:hypothetical protein
MLKSKLFFPDSDYLTSMWWHRLATVIFWCWQALVLVASGAFIVEAVLGWPDDSLFIFMFIGILIACILSVFIPSIVYRTILFVSKGNSWKDQRDAA